MKKDSDQSACFARSLGYKGIASETIFFLGPRPTSIMKKKSRPER